MNYTLALNKELAKKLRLSDELCNNIASIECIKGNYEKALNFYSMIQCEDSLYEETKSILFNSKAITYSKLGDFNAAVNYYIKSIKIRKILQDSVGLAVSYLNLGSLYYETYDNKNAFKYFTKSYDLAYNLKSNEFLEDIVFNLSLLYEDEKNYKKALQFYKRSDSIANKLIAQEKIWELSQIERKLAIQSKQLQISELETLNTRKELELTTRSTQRNALIAASLALLVIAGVVSIFLVQRNRASRIIRKQRNELETLNKTKDRLFSIIAHDLRSPVNSLQKKNVQAMKSMESGDLAMAQKMIRHIRKDTEQTSLLLNNLLHWSFTETGNLFLLPQPLLLRACIEQVIEELSFASHEKHISFDTDIPEQLIVTTDLNCLKIILRNLLQNALKFSYLNQSIRITCRQESTGTVIRIRDYGIGIPAELHNKLFNMDQEKIRKGTQNEPGSGLGLWLIQYLLQKNKGHISINPHTNPGTEITITLNHIL